MIVIHSSQYKINVYSVISVAFAEEQMPQTEKAEASGCAADACQATLSKRLLLVG